MQLLKVDLISKDNLLVQHKYAKRKYPELRCVKNFLPTPPTFHKNIRFGIKITVSQCEVFPFYPAKISKKSYKKVTRRREETHPYPHPRRPQPDISRSIFKDQSSNRLMFICLYFTRRDLNTKKIGQSQGSLSTMYQIIEKLSVVFSKESDMSWITLWLSFLSGVNRNASCILSHY